MRNELCIIILLTVCTVENNIPRIWKWHLDLKNEVVQLFDSMILSFNESKVKSGICDKPSHVNNMAPVFLYQRKRWLSFKFCIFRQNPMHVNDTRLFFNRHPWSWFWRVPAAWYHSNVQFV